MDDTTANEAFKFCYAVFGRRLLRALEVSEGRNWNTITAETSECMFRHNLSELGRNISMEVIKGVFKNGKKVKMYYCTFPMSRLEYKKGYDIEILPRMSKIRPMNLLYGENNDKSSYVKCLYALLRNDGFMEIGTVITDNHGVVDG